MTGPIHAIVAGDVFAVAGRDLPWERLAGCRVAVTGAAGFLGGALVRSLLALYRLGRVSSPVKVLAVVRDVERARIALCDVADDPALEWLACDLESVAGLPDLGDAQYVIHAASKASPRFYGTDPVGTLLPNVLGTAALLQALTRAPNPRGFLFVSSCEVYGAVAGDVAIREQDVGVVDPAQLRACYAEGKRAGETLCVSWQRQHGLPVYIGRLFHTYGPGLAAEDGRVFADFSYNVARGEHIRMNSDGSARRAFCYVSDAVAGLLTVLLRGAPGEPYNVANGQAELSIAELAQLVVSLYPEKRLTVERRETGDTPYMPSSYQRFVPDVRRLRRWGGRRLCRRPPGFAA